MRVLVAAAVAFIAVALLTSGGDDNATSPARTSSAATGGAAIFAQMGCGSCHRLAAVGSEGEFGPSLDERLANHTRASLRAAIVNPPPNSMMPTDFGARLGPEKLDALVRYLLATRS